MRAIPERQNQKQLVIFLDKAIHRAIKVYATETDQTMQNVLKEPIAQLEQAAFKIVSEIELIKSKDAQRKLKEEEERKIIEEHPIKVTGVPIEPITEIIDHQTC